MKRIKWLLVGAWLTICAIPALAADKAVGVVMSGNIGYYQSIHKAFVGALIKEGYDHHKVDTLLQMPSPEALSWMNATRRLVVSEVNVLVTYGAPGALAAISETHSIPIVYAGVYDPSAAGVSAKNVTGISARVPMTSVLKYLKKILPFAKLAVVYNEQEPDSARQAEELKELEGQYGFKTIRMSVKRPDEAKKLSFAGKADAVFISSSALVNEEIDAVIRSAHAAKAVTISMTGGAADHGVILSLAPSATEQGEAVARLVARLLKGEKPAGMPAEFPKQVDLVLNLKEAEAIGVKVPFDLISDATRVIK